MPTKHTSGNFKQKNKPFKGNKNKPTKNFKVEPHVLFTYLITLFLNIFVLSFLYFSTSNLILKNL